MTEADVKVRRGPKVPAIWLVPVVAAVLGIWLVIYTFMTEGPEITITLGTAVGIEAGKTKIRSLNVELGIVEAVELTKDMQRVLVTAKLERSAVPLLLEDTEFWVIRPRVGAGGISGLGTLLSGSFIHLAAGSGAKGRREFVGLDNPPVTPTGSPGLKLVLTSAGAASGSPGDPVLYRGYRVGQVENVGFDSQYQLFTYEIFVDEPYDTLVTRSTRFWNASGITLNATADGLEVQFGSLQTVLIGGIAFDLPTGEAAGIPAKNGDQFNLYANEDTTREQIYRSYKEYVVLFSQSVRGLSEGAPVEYRGIRIGTVQKILVDELVKESSNVGDAIPVLIRVEPGRYSLPDDATGVASVEASVRKGVPRGMRATLKIGNLVTGNALVAIDYYPDAQAAELGEFAGYVEIPTLATGIDRLEAQFGQLLTKLNALPVEPALVNLNDMLESIEALVGSDSAQAIPALIFDTLQELNATLDSISPDSEGGERLQQLLIELSEALRNIESLTRTLSEKPNTIIFSPPATDDPEVRKRPSP